MARKLVADNSFKQLDKFTKAGFQINGRLWLAINFDLKTVSDW